MRENEVAQIIVDVAYHIHKHRAGTGNLTQRRKDAKEESHV